MRAVAPGYVYDQDRIEFSGIREAPPLACGLSSLGAGPADRAGMAGSGTGLDEDADLAVLSVHLDIDYPPRGPDAQGLGVDLEGEHGGGSGRHPAGRGGGAEHQ